MSGACGGPASPSFEGFAAHYVQGPYASFVAEARLPADAPISMLWVRQPAGSFPDPPTPDLVLQLVTKGKGSAYLDLGATRGRVATGPGKLAIAPAGVGCAYDVSEPADVLILTLPFAQAQPVLDDLSGGTLADFAPVHRHDMPHDAVLASLMTRLWAEAANGSPMGPLLAENTAVAVAARVSHMTLQAHGLALPIEAVPPLHGPRLTRVLTRIEDGLAGHVSQSELAGIAGLSAWHFCRAFKAATGCAPHRFVLLRRLARTLRLLRTTTLGLAEVAAACGFSSHAHLTAVFKHQVGTTPSRWRTAARG